MLTPKQAQVLDFIVGYQRLTGTSPAYREIAAAMGMGNVSQVHAVIGRLEERGYLVKAPDQKRDIEVLEERHGAIAIALMPDGARPLIADSAFVATCRGWVPLKPKGGN